MGAGSSGPAPSPRRQWLSVVRAQAFGAARPFPPLSSWWGPVSPLSQAGRQSDTADLLQSAGVDLAEESSALLSTLGVAGSLSQNPFRGADEPVFCSKAALAALMKDAKQAK